MAKNKTSMSTVRHSGRVVATRRRVNRVTDARGSRSTRKRSKPTTAIEQELAEGRRASRARLQAKKAGATRQKSKTRSSTDVYRGRIVKQRRVQGEVKQGAAPKPAGVTRQTPKPQKPRTAKKPTSRSPSKLQSYRNTGRIAKPKATTGRGTKTRQARGSQYKKISRGPVKYASSASTTQTKRRK